MDDHLIYTVVLAGLALPNAGDTWGLGKRIPTLRWRAPGKSWHSAPSVRVWLSDAARHETLRAAVRTGLVIVEIAPSQEGHGRR